jgi:hypothetical protein
VPDFGTKVLGTTPGPIITVGPALPSPLVVPGAMIRDLRQSDDRVRTGQGFTNPRKKNFANRGRLEKDVCHRNATLLVLLCSSRLLSWIEHLHLPNLFVAGLVTDTWLEPRLKHWQRTGSLDESLIDEIAGWNTFTNLWCELYELSKL